MNQSVKTVLFWSFILLCGVLLWQFVKVGGSSREMEITFSKFMQDVDAGDVVVVVIQGNEVHGKYKRSNTVFHTIVPANYPDLIHELRDKGVSIQIKENTSSGLNLLINLSPLILFVALWFFMIRQIKGRAGYRQQPWRSATEPPPLSEVVPGQEAARQSPRLLLANAQGTLTFGYCKSQNRETLFYPESQIGPVAAWMLAPIPPIELLGAAR